MPHLEQKRIAELAVQPNHAKEEGDFNAMFFIEYLRAFIAEPKYKTIALIRKASVTPKKIKEVEDVDNMLIVLGVPALSRGVARDLAFTEFYQLIGRRYEDIAMKKNGVMPLLKKAQDILAHKELEVEGQTLGGTSNG